MAGYRFLAVDLLSHKLLAELPLTGVSWGQTLNAAGETQATLPLPADNPKLASIFVDATIPLRRALYIERDGVLMWGGPIWKRDMKTRTAMTLNAMEWLSLFNRRIIRATAIYIGQDQLVIAHDLIKQAQNTTGGALGVTVQYPVIESGVPRDRTYNTWEAKKVGEALSQLSAVEDGFDFAIDIAFQSDGSISRAFTTSYPYRGRLGTETGHVFEVGRNIVDIGWPEDGTNVANSWEALGAGDGADMLRVTSTNSALFDQGYPLLEDSVSLRDIDVEATLTEHADAYVAARGVPIVLPPVTVRGDIDPIVGSYICGDEARIRVQDDPRFPDGVDEMRRITSFKVKVPDSGSAAEEVTMSLDLPLS